MTEKGSETELDPVARFHAVYTNLPLKERIRVVVVINNEPISWEIARNEIIHGTRGKAILEKLIKLSII